MYSIGQYARKHLKFVNFFVRKYSKALCRWRWNDEKQLLLAMAVNIGLCFFHFEKCLPSVYLPWLIVRNAFHLTTMCLIMREYAVFALRVFDDYQFYFSILEEDPSSEKKK